LFSSLRKYHSGENEEINGSSVDKEGLGMDTRLSFKAAGMPDPSDIKKYG
jgi:hypothetical protein